MPVWQRTYDSSGPGALLHAKEQAAARLALAGTACAARRARRRGALLWPVLVAAPLVGVAPHAIAAPLPQEVTPSEAVAPAALEATPLEMALVDAVNVDRTAGGVAPVTHDPRLLAIARRRAADQVPLPQLSHYDADGQAAVAPLLAAAQIDYQLLGENLVRLPGPDATAVARAEEALMHSTDHRLSILDPRFDALTVGAVADDSGRVIFALLFRAAR